VTRTVAIVISHMARNETGRRLFRNRVNMVV
jgi:hypothetical protein